VMLTCFLREVRQTETGLSVKFELLECKAYNSFACRWLKYRYQKCAIMLCEGFGRKEERWNTRSSYICALGRLTRIDSNDYNQSVNDNLSALSNHPRVMGKKSNQEFHNRLMLLNRNLRYILGS
jgi:hypothetical protein